MIEQIVRLTLDAHSPEEMDCKHFREEENRKRQERAERVRTLGIDQAKLQAFRESCDGMSPERLLEDGEIEGERLGHGIVTALSLINSLEINEESLYGRMENIEQSTLVS